jgi:hypothetical protein
METNTARQNLAQAVEDGFHRRLLDEGGGHIEQGSISARGGRQSSTVFWHAHQTITERGRLDRAELLVDYLGVSDAQTVKPADRLAADGKYAVAAEPNRNP